MEKEKLIETIQDHHNWLNNEGGRRAILRGADLRGADFRGADLRGAVFTGAILRGADFTGADLRGADLRGAILRGAIFTDADLRGAIFTDADLRGAISYNQNCPQEGNFIGWKKAYHDKVGTVVLKLLIIGDRVSPIVGRKCRTNKCKVLSAEDMEGNALIGRYIFHSNHDYDFKYRIGDIAEEPNYNDTPFEECTDGIHFFISKQEAINW